MASSKAVPIVSLLLRLLTLTLLTLSIVYMARNRVTFSDGRKASFKDVIGYRYVVAVGIIGFVYTLLRVPAAVYLVWTGKRMTRGTLALELGAYGDMIIAFLLATGVGAGFAVTLDFRKFVREQELRFSPDDRSTFDKFFRAADVADGFLFLGFLCAAASSAISSVAKRNNDSRRGFFG